MKKKPKSLGEIAYEQDPITQTDRNIVVRWEILPTSMQRRWQKTAKAVERAVVKKLKAEGKLK